MKWIIHIIAVLLLSLSVDALPPETTHPNHLENRNVEQNAKKPDVVVLVNELGHTLGIDDLTPTTAAPDNSPTKPPLALHMPALDKSEELVSDVHSNTRASHRFGISYSAYNDDSSCKTQDQVNKDMDIMAGQYSFVRIYGVDCDQTRKLVSAARQRNIRVFLGVYDLNNFPQSLNPIIDAVAGDWSIVHTVSVGNELVNKGQNSPSDVVAAVHTARDKLRNAGYGGPVVTVDTANALIQHPELCRASDYCAANCHAFFNADITADKAGSFVLDQANRVSAAAGGNKRTVITETGWPHRGQTNGLAVPSRYNQLWAIITLQQSFRGRYDDLILFSAFDEQWKTDWPGTFEAEKWWGLTSYNLRPVHRPKYN